jgi:Uma2 family endonuclease
MRPRTGRAPDILFVTKENSSRLKKTFVDGPADLVVEIISPESRAPDRGEKYYEYEACGVREYWLLDPQRKQTEWYQLNENGIYQWVAAQDGVYHSRVLEGLWLREWKLI